MRLLIVGADGYLGWPTCLRFSARGRTVLAVDSLVKRAWEREMATGPLAPVLNLEERAQLWQKVSGLGISTVIGDICDAGFIEELVRASRPDVLVHFAQQPSAPFSMLSEERTVLTQVNNVGLQKLGVQPRLLTKEFLMNLLQHLHQFTSNVNPAALEPGRAWGAGHGLGSPGEA
jgi:nucleoside-diphosphate-sugar epimerase